VVTQHELVVRHIAATRFPFPDQNINPGNHGLWPKDYVTILNAEKKQQGVQFGDKTGYPDILILNSKNEVRELGEVESEEDLAPTVLEKWRAYATAASIGPRGYPKFFIYVPIHKELPALKMLKESGLRYAGLRSYEVSKGGKITIKETVTYDP
jgi:hypothetical protein